MEDPLGMIPVQYEKNLLKTVGGDWFWKKSNRQTDRRTDDGHKVMEKP